MANSTLHEKPFRHYLRKHPRVFAMGVVALLFTNLFDVLTPLSLKAGIDALEARSPERLGHAVLLYAGLMCGVTVFRYLWRIYFGRFHHSVAEDLRNRIFDKLISLGPSFYSRTPTGQLMSLLTNDVNTFRQAIGPGFLILLDAVFYSAMILPVMISLSWSWTWKALIVLPLLPPFMKKMETLIHERFREQQDRLADMSARAQEVVSGIRPIKSFAQENNQADSFNRLSREFETTCNRVAKVDFAFHPAMMFSVTIGSCILLWFCTDEVSSGAVTLGTFVAFQEYIKRMTWPMTAIGSGISMVEQGRASFDRIGELLRTETDIPDLGVAAVASFKSLEVRGLTFTYPGSTSPALQDVNFVLRAGETLGVVGPVGAGKTTLLQVLTRLYPVEGGRILVNGASLETFSRAAIAATISLVPQDAFLFSDTVSQNVALGLLDFPGLEPIHEAAATVNIDHEIRQIPEGFAAYLGERGVNLSGGQKQRLTIARALIRRSPLVMLDDSLSAVDAKTEQAIVGALREGRASDQAVILVSHRLATLKHADRIMVLNAGSVEAIGTHEELLVRSDTYRRLSELQDSTDVDSSFAEVLA